MSGDWQGMKDKRILGTTVLRGLQEMVGEDNAIFDPTGETMHGAQVALMVASEKPYAEWFGDSADIAFPPEDAAILAKLQQKKLPVVVVLLTGRPLIVEPHLAHAAAWLVAWLPGSEGGAVADVLFGAAPPRGKLAHSWPRTVADIPSVADQRMQNPLFAFGYGLTY